jgi:hypothetical protein
MADLTITAANVLPGSGATVKYGTSGATIAAGKTVYLDPADNKWKLADSNGASALIRQTKGIALNGASDGQPIAVLTEGPITIGAAVTLGTAYYQSDTPGGICPVADVGAGEEPTVIGVATSTTVISVKLNSAGATI